MQHSLTTLLALMAASPALCHMNMAYPAPLNYKGNPNAASGSIDYSITSPLTADGSNYPCKGTKSLLGTSQGASVASFAAGGQYNVTLEGGANHGGGSCQLSLSTDNMATFTVIKSFIGNCPATTGTSQLDFTMPADAPSGDAVFAWTWNNNIGNREFYMNCAVVTITGASSKAKREHEEKRDTAYSSRPSVFVANLSGVNTCTVGANENVEYPSPGPDVTRSGSSTKPTGDCGAISSDSGSSGSSSSSGSAASSSAVASAPASSAVASASASIPGGVFITASAGASSAAATQPAATSAAAQPTTLATSAVAATGTTAASPASGTGTSSAGAMTAGTACTNEGAWNCIGGTQFQRCASGQWSAVMAMSSGTSCSPGVSENLVSVRRRYGNIRRRSNSAWAR